MKSLIFSFLAAGSSSLSSLSLRKNEDNLTSRGSPSGYLVLFYLFSLVLSLIFFPAIWKTHINIIILTIGACVGIFNSTLMFLTSEALKQGPSGLTFAFQNASAIFPGLILFLFLGSDFGFTCSSLQLAGMALVLLGLFLDAKSESTNSSKASFKWLKYTLICFFLQILALTFIQGRCVLFGIEMGGMFSNFKPTEADDVWFMPGQFGAALIMQAIIFLYEHKKFKKSEVIYGCLGGVVNFSSTVLLLLATKFALPFEKGILFPCFAVGSMILCNIWANRIYHEKFNLKSSILCTIGIFLAVKS